MINNRENLFFSQAQNQGIKASCSEFILCLNDDVILEKNFVEELVKAIGLDTRIGMVSGKILRMDKITVDSTGLFLGRSRKPVEGGFNQRDNGQYNKEEYIFGACVAAAFYRRKMLEEIREATGYFDERFFFLVEDIDFVLEGTKERMERCTILRQSASILVIALASISILGNGPVSGTAFIQ